MLPDFERYDSIVIGGGFFGLYTGEFLALRGEKVLVCEQYPQCMTRASYNNQARVHSEYHYPRSLLTAMRSCISFPMFIKEFGDCVKSDFDKYYGIGAILGKVTARQFETFCRRIGAPCEPAPQEVAGLFSPHYIEQVFRTREYAFDAAVLRRIMLDRFNAANGELVCNCRVEKIYQKDNGELGVTVKSQTDGTAELTAATVYNCTYSNINSVNHNSGIELIPLKHEMTEMALVETPDNIANMGITIMCGPFFSIMPFPDRGLHSFSHVRYTPHYEWHDKNGQKYVNAHRVFDADPKTSCFESMRRDAARYMPAAGECQYKDSLWEVKTILPSSEIDDSRPILFKPNYHYKNYHCIMGGKIDNVYDVIAAIKLLNNW